jgi:hypothetical protein
MVRMESYGRVDDWCLLELARLLIFYYQLQHILKSAVGTVYLATLTVHSKISITLVQLKVH